MIESDFSKYSLMELNEIIAKAIDARRIVVDRRRAELLAELQVLEALEEGQNSLLAGQLGADYEGRKAWERQHGKFYYE
ncbi:hypothetical protein [Rhizobium sp. A37_96]